MQCSASLLPLPLPPRPTRRAVLEVRLGHAARPYKTPHTSLRCADIRGKRRLKSQIKWVILQDGEPTFLCPSWGVQPASSPLFLVSTGLTRTGALTLGARSYTYRTTSTDSSLPFLCKDKEVFIRSHPRHLPLISQPLLPGSFSRTLTWITCRGRHHADRAMRRR